MFNEPTSGLRAGGMVQCSAYLSLISMSLFNKKLNTEVSSSFALFLSFQKRKQLFIWEGLNDLVLFIVNLLSSISTCDFEWQNRNEIKLKRSLLWLMKTHLITK
jgi:hypothetical protein